MRCLFLAPMKPPDHPTPSGDRLIARQFMALLGRLGYEVELASRMRTRCASPEDLDRLVALAEAEAERILAAERAAADSARLVFTYHNYYRAPDLIGPRLAAALGLPYVLAESSRSPKRAAGDWAAAHARAEAASDAARLILAPTAHDMAMLERLRPPGQHVVRLPPFLDFADWPIRPKPPRAEGPLRLVTVAMMRRGNKLSSYLSLAAILARLGDDAWTLDIVGDGEGRPEIEAAFARFGQRIRFHGAIDDRRRLGALLAAGDAFVWPAVEEPIGMVFLEAQAHGLPCIGYGYRGVPDVVAEGVSGHVVAPSDEAAFAARLDAWIAKPATVEALGRSAQRRFFAVHGADSAAQAAAAAFRAAGLPLPARRV